MIDESEPSILWGQSPEHSRIYVGDSSEYSSFIKKDGKEIPRVTVHLNESGKAIAILGNAVPDIATQNLLIKAFNAAIDEKNG